MEEQQLAQLQKLLAALLPANAFYSAKLGAAGVTGPVASLDEFFTRVPFTLKQELLDDQLSHPPFGSNLTYPLERYNRFCQTSGTSTGNPLRWLDTPESWDWMLANWTRVYQAAGVSAKDHIFFAFSFGPFLGFWTAFESAARLGCLLIPGGGMRSALRLRTLIDTACTVLCCTPTYAIRLAEVAAEEKIDLAECKVRQIVTAGEPGGSIPGTRALIEKLWPGAAVVDHHGMTETGPVSYGCPSRPCVLHVIESSYIAEIIDAAGNPAAPGENGELILTNLGRLGSPLLRYRTGDIVRRGPAGRCVCGAKDLALDGGILGRTDDMVIIRGVNVYPSRVEDIVRSYDGVAEYSVELRTGNSLPELVIQVEPSHEAAAGMAPALEVALADALALRVSVSCVPRGALPRFEAKAKRWTRK